MNNGYGYINAFRVLQSHWIWENAKHLKWWFTILFNVNFKQVKIPIENRIYTCNEGQSIRSLDTWASLMGCSKKTVIRFFDLLQTDGMITINILGKGNQRRTLLTVVNWHKYQHSGTENYTEKEPETTPESNQKLPRNNKEKNNINEKKENNTYKYLFSFYRNFVLKFNSFLKLDSATEKDLQTLLYFLDYYKQSEDQGLGIVYNKLVNFQIDCKNQGIEVFDNLNYLFSNAGNISNPPKALLSHNNINIHKILQNEKAN